MFNVVAITRLFLQRRDVGQVVTNLSPYALALLAFALRVWQLGAQSLWWDEVFVVLVGKMPFPDWFTWVFFEERSHPPGFFFVMSLWTQLGVGEFVVRYASVIWGTLSVPLIYLVGRRLGGRKVGVLGALFLSISPFHVWYSQEARMYAPQMFLALLSSYLFSRLLTGGERRVIVAFVATSVAGLYVFYLFPLILLAQLVFFILARRHYRAALLRWLVANSVAAVLFLPWLIAILATGGFARAAIGWIQPAQWYDPAITLYTLVVGATNNPWDAINWLAPLVFTGLGIYGLCLARQAPRRDLVSYHLLWLLIPFSLIFLISLPYGVPQKRSLYSDRYLIPELPALTILVSFGAAQLLQRRPRLALSGLGVAALSLFVALWGMYFNPAYARDDWRAVNAYLASRADPVDDRVALEASLTWPFSYYDRLHLSRIVFYPDPDLAKKKFDEVLWSNSKSRLWLLTATILGSAHRFPPAPEEQLAVARGDIGKRLLDQRYPIESEALFQGILVTVYRMQP